MNKVDVIDTKGGKVGEVTLNSGVFSDKPSSHILWESVRMHLAGLRAGTHSTKRRSEVRGGGRKPYAQKGTGRARQGSIRSPNFVGGGGVFTPKPRDYSYSLPKKARKVALRAVLADKFTHGHLIVMDDLFKIAGKTKEVASVLRACKIESALLVSPDNNDAFFLAVRNMPCVKAVVASEVCVYDVLKYEKMIVSQEVLTNLQESLLV